jgi:hypothetical protein
MVDRTRTLVRYPGRLSALFRRFVPATTSTGCAILLVAHGALAVVPVQDAAPLSLGEESLPSAPVDAAGYRTLGNRYIEEGRSDLAAEAYRRALALDRRAFSVDERTAMAIRMSWEDMLDDSARELETVLSEDPGHLGARIHLARIHSWSDDLGAAIREADRVLRDFPENPEALVVKADSLEWQGRSESAIPLYRRSIRAGESFDARVGLAYALLSSGDRKGASEQAGSVLATIPAQEERLRDLLESIDETRAPQINVGYTYYEDSDDNRVHRTTVDSSFGVGNYDFSSTLSRTETTGRSGTRRTEQVSIGIFRGLNERFGVGGGLNLSRFEGEGSFGRPTGRLEFRSRVFDGEIGVRLTRELLVDTVELVDDRTRATRASIYADLPVGRRFSVSAEYGQRRMSDSNRAHDIGAGVSYDLSRFARVGYRLRFADYARNSGAYFAPSAYVSHRVFGSIGMEWDRVYVFAEAYVGPQRFERNGFTTEDLSIGGWLSVGFRPASFVTIELNGDSGDLAAGSVSGFKYFSVGPRVSFIF